MAGDGRVWDGALRQAGAVTASSPAELLTLAEAAIGQPRAPGPRVAILADGGGHATMAADAAEAAGLSVMELSPSVRRALSPYLLPHSSSRNPVDFAGAAEADLWSFVRCAEVLLSADEVDGLLLAGQFGGYYDVFPAEAQLEERVAAALPPLPARFAKPMVVHTIYANAPSAAVRVLRGGGVPVVEEIRTATAALASLVARERPGGLQPGPALARARPAGARGGRPRQVPVEEATATLSARHVPVVPMIPARSELEAEHAARCVGFPVAVKGVAAGLVHKTDAGAVILGCPDEASVRAAFGQVTTAARRADPADPDLHAVVCPMVGGVEAIVGASRDPTFGPVVMFGLGGVFAEVLGDASFRVAPVDRTIAMAMIRELRAFPVLAGTRGTAVDLEAAARIIVEISRLITDDPNLVELDLNPVFLGPAGAHVADVRLLVAGNAEPERHPQDSATRRA